MIFTVLLRDVSERKRLEEERLRLLELEREARLLAERAARLRDEVLGVVSHDLRNPLSVIAMCAQGLESNEDNGRTAVRELSDTIKEATNWMQHLIKDLLDVASIEAGKLSLERKSCNVVISIVRSIDMLEPLASQASVSLLTDIPDDLPNVNADSDRIIQVLVNLIGNAIKFSGAERNVKVRAETSGDEVVITIVDSGPGIPADELDNVFERFWKSRRGSGASGTGLGLAIARGIVDAHRGRIWVDSVVGEGSQFHFTLPVAARTR
jgi:signal transduction histidine kinase